MQVEHETLDFNLDFRLHSETLFPAGVTVPQIRAHLLKIVQGFQVMRCQFQQALSSVHNTGPCYKGFIDARIDINSNCCSECHPRTFFVCKE